MLIYMEESPLQILIYGLFTQQQKPKRNLFFAPLEHHKSDLFLLGRWVRLAFEFAHQVQIWLFSRLNLEKKMSLFPQQ